VLIIQQKLIKHDRYLESLCDKIEPDYDRILRNIPLYSRRKRLIGEIDILAVKDDHCDIYEVKCSHRFHKAHKQLYKIRKILHENHYARVKNMFFFCGESGLLMNI
jgi:hypothetical protein